MNLFATLAMIMGVTALFHTVPGAAPDAGQTPSPLREVFFCGEQGRHTGDFPLVARTCVDKASFYEKHVLRDSINSHIRVAGEVSLDLLDAAQANAALGNNALAIDQLRIARGLAQYMLDHRAHANEGEIDVAQSVLHDVSKLLERYEKRTAHVK